MEFTVEEKDRINLLYGTDFKDITPADAMLIGRWEAHKALKENEHQAKIAAIEAETAARLEATEKQAKQAADNLAELHEIALARLERLQDGI